MSEGDEGDTFFILEKGEAVATKILNQSRITFINPHRSAAASGVLLQAGGLLWGDRATKERAAGCFSDSVNAGDCSLARPGQLQATARPPGGYPD